MNPTLAGALMGAGGVMFATYIAWEIVGIVKRRRSSQGDAGTVVHGDQSPTNIQGDLNIGVVHYYEAGGKYRAVIDGRGEIVSSTPIRISASAGVPTALVRLVPPRSAIEDKRDD